MEPSSKKETIANRIRHLMRLRGITSLQALADASGVKVGTLKSSGSRGSLSRKNVAKLAAFFDVPVAWLDYGEEARSDTSGAYLMESDEEREAAQPTVEAPPLIAPGEREEVDTAEFVFLREATARLSGGHGLIPMEGFTGEPYAFRRSWLRRVASSVDNVVLMQVEGDSMSPTLQNGNVVLIDLGRNKLKLGRIFAIGIGDIIAVKRMDMVKPGILIIHSDNPAYGKEQHVPLEEVRIIGEVIWSARTWV